MTGGRKVTNDAAFSTIKYFGTDNQFRKFALANVVNDFIVTILLQPLDVCISAVN